ncbi:MAG TPA: hypothetical protein VKT52_03325 [Ktedonobacterales bacterium]|nr:hypothetical protein [Ktedonobacterales bacterium]
MTVGISYYPLVNDYLRQKECQTQTNATLANLPAIHDDAYWTVWSSAVEYQLSFAIGNRGDTMQTEQNLPTPVPQGVFQSDQQLYAEIIATFHPIPATRLSCSGS